MQRRLIGIAGPARSGKDTLGKILQLVHNAKLYGFADPLKAAASKMFGIDPAIFSGDNPNREEIDPRWGYSPRHLLQLLGTEGGRYTFREDMWIINAQQALDKYRVENPDGLFVVTDVRFDNEASWIRSLGGCIVHMQRLNSGIQSDHSSEAGVCSTWEDFVMPNDGSISDMVKVVEEVSWI